MRVLSPRADSPRIYCNTVHYLESFNRFYFINTYLRKKKERIEKYLKS